MTLESEMLFQLRAVGENYSFFVGGQPVPKQSFRKTKTGGYTDPRVTAWEQIVGYNAKEIIKDPLKGTVSVRMYFYLADNRVVDLDNLSKAVLDGLKGIAFGDDSKVTRLLLAKEVRNGNPGVFIALQEIESYLGGDG